MKVKTMTELNTLSADIANGVANVEASVHGAFDKLSGVASQTMEKLDQAGHKLQETQSRVTSQCRGVVQENPLAAVAVAVATGVLLGVALQRR